MAAGGHREIQLTKGLVALVDAEDFHWLSRWKWHAHVVGSRTYAARNASKAERAAGAPCSIYLHREVLPLADGRLVDHANRDTLDDRRANLRAASYVENGANSGRTGGSSIYRGVCVDRRRGKFRAEIRPGGRSIFLGYFNEPIGAARAYDAAAREHYGAFAALNFPEAA